MGGKSPEALKGSTTRPRATARRPLLRGFDAGLPPAAVEAPLELLGEPWLPVDA